MAKDGGQVWRLTSQLPKPPPPQTCGNHTEWNHSNKVWVPETLVIGALT